MLDSDACFVGPDLILRSCYCPMSSCMETVTGAHQCMYTGTTIAIAIFAVTLWFCGIGVYWYASSSIDDESLLPQRAQSSKINDVLFGVYHASDHGTVADTGPAAAASPTEATSLVAAGSAKATSHGTF